jgi:hypothetical protein
MNEGYKQGTRIGARKSDVRVVIPVGLGRQGTVGIIANLLGAEIR